MRRATLVASPRRPPGYADVCPSPRTPTELRQRTTTDLPAYLPVLLVIGRFPVRIRASALPLTCGFVLQTALGMPDLSSGTGSMGTDWERRCGSARGTTPATASAAAWATAGRTLV